MIANPPSFDVGYFRSALGRFPTGVTVVTCQSTPDLNPVGLTISSFNSVSLDPPLILWSLSKASSLLPAFQETKRYVVHVLSAQQLHLAKRFASGTQTDRFAQVATSIAPGGGVMLADDSAAWFECINQAQHDAGDHIVFIGQVEHCHHSFAQPLVYHAGDFDLTPSSEPLTSR
ncbi:flavin reductase family protein [Alcaligenaceae bacterium]|nr:flavin reductase family protein [Alcaligenaceae bacterium]